MQVVMWFAAYLVLIVVLAVWREHHDGTKPGKQGGAQRAWVPVRARVAHRRR